MAGRPDQYGLNMPRNDRYRRYFEAAAVLGQITRARAEELVKDLMGSGDDQHAHAQQWVDELVDRGRDAAGDLVETVRTEVSKQLQGLGLDPEDLARQAADVMRRSAAAGRRVVQDVASGTGTRTRAPRGRAGGEGTETAQKAAGAKRAASSAAHMPAAPTAKKTVTKKAAATKAAATKAPATKKAAATKAPTKKPAATKAPAAKNAAATKAGPAGTAGATRSQTRTTDAR